MEGFTFLRRRGVGVAPGPGVQNARSALVPTALTPEPGKPWSHVIDLDGTLSDDSWRVHYLPDYDDYNCGLIYDDPINTKMVEFIPSGEHLIYLTARPEKWRELTEEWLARNISRRHSLLVMRPKGNMMSSPELKVMLLEREILPVYSVVSLVDDRVDVLAAAQYAFGGRIGAYWHVSKRHVQLVRSTDALAGASMQSSTDALAGASMQS